MLHTLLLLKQELIVSLIILILLFLKVSTNWTNSQILLLINILLLMNVASGLLTPVIGSVFGEMFKTGMIAITEKNILSFGTFLISLLGYSWLKDHEHLTEFYLLLLSTLLGMFFMISAGNLLMFYLSLELATIPLAAMCNFDLQKRKSSEAAMKYIMSSAFSSGILLFGISLIYGIYGTLDFSTISTTTISGTLPVFAFILLLSGFAFKISAVPFHLWTADVYEGAPVTVTAYLSVISKGAIFFVFVPVLYIVFKQLSTDWYRMLCVLSVATMITGNLFAIRQQNLKRLLAFSSITQVGFLLIGISGSSAGGMAAVIFFILIYIFSNGGAFAVIALISSVTGKESINDYKGLYKTNPFLTWVLSISLFSLAGIPPTAGFFGKFFLLIAGAGKSNYGLITIAALNMIVSMYYYLKVVKAMFMDSNDQPIEKLVIPLSQRVAMYICIVGIIFTGLFGNIFDYFYQLAIIR